MLDFLRSRDQGYVLAFAIELIILDDVTALLDQPFHRLAGLALGRLAQLLEDPLQAIDLPLGLLQVLLEGRLQLGR